MTKVPGEMPAYTYGKATVGTSPVSLEDLEQLKVSVGFTADDERYLRQAGEVLEGQTKRIVEHWRSGIIAGLPYTALRDAVLTHPTLMEGLIVLFSSAPVAVANH